MSYVHTEFPSGEGHWGESQFAEKLVEIGDDETHFWFGINYLFGVHDLDVVICHPRIGVFAIEVKAIPLRAIDEYGPGLLRISGRHGSKHPLQQSNAAKHKLVEHLRDTAGLGRGAPFVYASAALPLINRDEFLDRWGSRAVIPQAEGMLFEDDVVSTRALLDRLKHASLKPPIGAAPSYTRLPIANISSIVDALAPGAVSPPSARDKAQMRGLDNRSRDRRRKYIKPGSAKEVVFQGPPGTGKTYRLLEIARAHARAGRSVLFVCYNKVLGADLRRLLLAADSSEDIEGRMEVLDIHQFLDRHALSQGTYEERVADLRGGSQATEVYGTVLIDEAQDLEGWAYDLLRWCSEPQAEWFIADGKGQSLYLDEVPPWLSAVHERAKSSGTVEQQSRVFRAAQADFYVAQCTHELSPDIAGIDAWMTKRVQVKSTDQMSLDLEEFDTLGAPPSLIEMPDEAKSNKAARVQFIADAIGLELEAVKKLGNPGDVAILVPNLDGKGFEGDWARAALASLDVDYVDQIKSEDRRRALPAGSVRIVTFHSARGIEASRVIVLGLEHLGSRTGGNEQRQRNLAYVALSRAKFGSKIIVHDGSRNPHVQFVKSVVEKLADRIEASETQATAIDGIWRNGTVARFVRERGFGFLASEAGVETFFHVSSVFGIDTDAIAEDLPVRYAVVSGDKGSQASMVCESVPAVLLQPADSGLVPAILVEEISERGFGFLLSPHVAGRIFLHEKQVAGLRADQLHLGDRLDVECSKGSDGKNRASKAIVPS